MLIPGDNEVSCGLYGTFEDAIIRFIGENVEMGSRLYNGCHLGNGFQKPDDLILWPAKFVSELLGCFSQNGNG